MQIKKKFSDGVYIYILPPSIDDLRTRLLQRGDPQEEIQRRIYASYRSVEHPATFFVDTSRGKEEVAEETHRQVREFFEATERVL